MLRNGITVMTVRNEMKYPIWAIKRYDEDIEQEVNLTGYPGYDHAIWYWWDLSMGHYNRYNKITWDAALERLTHHNKTLVESPYTKVDWERLDDNNWRVIAVAGGNRVVIGNLRKVSRIANPESTYRWYRE